MSIMKKLTQLTNRGDTIVEVLLVVVILGTIIVGTYGIATRSQRANQQTQEHTEALKLAEGQIELLRSYAGALPASGKFCLADDSGSTVKRDIAGTAPTPNANDDVFSDYATAGCQQPRSGEDCAANVAFCYNVGVVKSGDLFTVTVRWPGINNQKDNVSLLYRMPAL